MKRKERKYGAYLNGRGACIAAILLFPCVLFAQTSEEQQEISSKLTQEFVPAYKEYSSKDSTRSPAAKLGAMQDRKLIFFDDFVDNRHCWSHYASTSDSLLSVCSGFENNKVCHSKPTQYIDSYTNMEEGKKVLFAFTPDIKLKYSRNVPVPLSKNYVVTLNPLSIKPVSKLPNFYYEGYMEHVVRIQNSLQRKDLVIEASVERAIGAWGIMFGDLASVEASYYFKLKPDDTYELKAIYPGDRSKPVTLTKGTLPMGFSSVKTVAIDLDYRGDNTYRVTLKANDENVGHMTISKLIVGKTDVGFRLDHTSIEGNNILIANELAVYEKVVPTYLEESVNFSGAWKGTLMRGRNKVYDVDLQLQENASGLISGEIKFQHVKYPGTVISKNFKAVRHKHIINFEDRSTSAKGIYNEVVRFSLLQMGHMEVINPDSMLMQSFVTNNLHILGEFDKEFNLNSNRIYLSRVEKTIEDNPIQIDPKNQNPLVEVIILFKPNSYEMANDKENKENLDALARSLHKYLAENPERLIVIHGHTDLGYEQMNSLMRANTIRGELLKRGIPSAIFCIGHGHSQRVSERGDPRNRRVEVEVLKIDSAVFEGESVVMSADSRAYFLKSLPEQFVIQTDFKQRSGRHFIVFQNRAGGVHKFEIPNTAGGQRQSLRIIKKLDPEEGMVLEYWLDDVRVRRETANEFVKAGFDSADGTIEIENINIFAPK